MRYATLIGAALAVLSIGAIVPAQAGLIGNGTNTVAALFYLGAASVPAVISSTAPYTNPAPDEIEGPMGVTNPPAPPSLIPATFLAVLSPLAASDITVGDTQIIITNQSSLPFCSTALPCSNVFTGFGFVFFGNVNITNVTVDPASSPAFLPIAGGLSFGATDIFVNVVGDAPNIDDQLILDVSTAAIIPSVPEPATITLFAISLLGVMLPRRRSRRQASPTDSTS